MNAFLQNLLEFVVGTLPLWGLFIVSFVLCYFTVPVCRALAVRFGMVDQPSARRINKTPIPRSGGLAIFLAFTVTVLGYAFFTGNRISPAFQNAVMFKLCALALALVVVGLLDDKFSLPAKVKLAGQLAVALGAFFWCGIGFRMISILSWMPVWLDCLCTVFWIVGAVNAFNLIDGLDGLATGLALIAAVGMGGALFFIGYRQCTLVYFVLGAACLAFLRYNFNPASIFLGDTGSMFLGFIISTLALATKSGDTFFISVGVPMLAMGVPIFDTTLAILRRTVRAILNREEKGCDHGNAHMMTADTDHLHHRILRKFVSQKKAVWALYSLAAFFTLIALGGIALRDKAAGFFMLAFVVAVIIVVRDMRRIELYDAGRLLDTIAHATNRRRHRRLRMLSVPYFVGMDVFLLVMVSLFSAILIGKRIDGYLLHTVMPITIVPTFLCLVYFRTYSTVWSRAILSNYMRLAASCFIGTMIGSAGIAFFNFAHTNLIQYSVLYFALSLMALIAVRLVRPIVRDAFYAINHGRMADDACVSRIIVYGAGLRYNMFRRELVRSSTKGKRIIVGIIDDDLLLRNHYIGGRRVYGTVREAPEIIKELRADAVVIACEISPDHLAHAKKVFAGAGVKVSLWSCEEKEV